MANPNVTLIKDLYPEAPTELSRHRFPFVNARGEHAGDGDYQISGEFKLVHGRTGQEYHFNLPKKEVWTEAGYHFGVRANAHGSISSKGLVHVYDGRDQGGLVAEFQLTRADIERLH
jgi:hypothetical protein